MLPNPAAVSKLIKRYIKVERDYTLEKTVDLAGYSKTLYYHRIKDPGNFTLAEVRSFGKALKIPPEEMLTALAQAIRY